MGSNQYWAGRVYDLCVYFMTGTPEGLTECGFMEKPGIEPATPGLQDIGLTASLIVLILIFLSTLLLKPTANWPPYIFTLVQKVKHRVVYKIHVSLREANFAESLQVRKPICDIVFCVMSFLTFYFCMLSFLFSVQCCTF